MEKPTSNTQYFKFNLQLHVFKCQLCTYELKKDESNVEQKIGIHMQIFHPQFLYSENKVKSLPDGEQEQEQESRTCEKIGSLLQNFVECGENREIMEQILGQKISISYVPQLQYINFSK